MSLTTQARSKLANTVKFLGPDHPHVRSARRDFEWAKLEEHAQRVVTDWPRPADEQLRRVAALLRTTAGGAK